MIILITILKTQCDYWDSYKTLYENTKKQTHFFNR